MRRREALDKHSKPIDGVSIVFSRCPAHRGEPKEGSSGPVCYFTCIGLLYDADVGLSVRDPNCELIHESDYCLVSQNTLEGLLEEVEEEIQEPNKPPRVEKNKRLKQEIPAHLKQREKSSKQKRRKSA